MTSFHALSIGQITEFHRVLASAGLTKEGVERIIADPSLAATMVESLSVTRIPRIYVREDQLFYQPPPDLADKNILLENQNYLKPFEKKSYELKQEPLV